MRVRGARLEGFLESSGWALRGIAFAVAILAILGLVSLLRSLLPPPPLDKQQQLNLEVIRRFEIDIAASLRKGDADNVLDRASRICAIAANESMTRVDEAQKSCRSVREHFPAVAAPTGSPTPLPISTAEL